MPKSSLLDQRLEWVGIGKVLSSYLLRVPSFQRSFAWGKAELEDFWDDLSEALKDKSEYFLGPIVVTAPNEEDHRLTIIDGQQRLATATILLSVFRDKLIKLGDTDTANDIDHDFMGSRDLRTRKFAAKLLLNDEDRAFFTSVISEKATGAPPPSLLSQRRILAAVDYFDGRIESERPEQGKFRDWVIDWVDHIRDRAVVMFAQIPEEADAYTIFETLNARGSDLALADLLKNHLFSMSNKSLDDVKRSWTMGMDRISQVDETATADFLRHYWNSHKPLAREKDLYRSFRKEIRSEKEARTYARNLEDASEDYSALLTGKHPKWSELGTKTAQAFEDLFSFGLGQNRSLLLAAMRTLEDNELSRLLRSLVTWSIRGLVVGGIGKGKTETTYAKAALAVSDKKAAKVEAIFKELESIIPSDVEFERAFQSYIPPTNKRIHYLLRALEMGNLNKEEPYLVPNPDHQELTIEHVLPRNPNPSEWPQFNKEQLSSYPHRLGNLALVIRMENKSLGNKPFATKVQVYEKADATLTKELAKHKLWTPESIESRQRELASLALRVWARTPRK